MYKSQTQQSFSNSLTYITKKPLTKRITLHHMHLFERYCKQNKLTYKLSCFKLIVALFNLSRKEYKKCKIQSSKVAITYLNFYMNVSEKTVRTAVNDCEQMGLIQVLRGKRLGNKNTTNIYDLNVENINKFFGTNIPADYGQYELEKVNLVRSQLGNHYLQYKNNNIILNNKLKGADDKNRKKKKEEKSEKKEKKDKTPEQYISSTKALRGAIRQLTFWMKEDDLKRFKPLKITERRLALLSRKCLKSDYFEAPVCWSDMHYDFKENVNYKFVQQAIEDDIAKLQKMIDDNVSNYNNLTNSEYTTEQFIKELCKEKKAYKKKEHDKKEHDKKESTANKKNWRDIAAKNKKDEQLSTVSEKAETVQEQVQEHVEKSTMQNSFFAEQINKMLEDSEKKKLEDEKRREEEREERCKRLLLAEEELRNRNINKKGLLSWKI